MFSIHKEKRKEVRERKGKKRNRKTNGQFLQRTRNYKTKIQLKNAIMWNAGFKGELKIRVKTTKKAEDM